MKREQYEKLVQRKLSVTKKIIAEKSEAYDGTAGDDDDVFGTIKLVARAMKTCPEQALLFHVMKHIGCLVKQSERLKEGKDPSVCWAALDSRSNDVISYMLMLEGLFEERREQSVQDGTPKM